MRGRLATTRGYRKPPTFAVSPPVYAKVPVEAIRESPAGSSMVGVGRSCLFSQREKIEMRGRLATTTGYRSPPTLAVSHPVHAKVPIGAIRESPSGSSMGGVGRPYLFSQREKIEMRGRLATTTGYRSPPTFAASHPGYTKIPVGAIRESPSQGVAP